MNREPIEISAAESARLERECAKLDPREEQALADETYAGEIEPPEY